MKHLFIVNPACGKGISAQRCAGEITEAMDGMGIGNYEIYVTKRPNDGCEYAKKQVEKGEDIRVYACGGDGTLYEAVNACACHSNAQVSAIPLGSGNDFIRLFGSKQKFLNIADHVNGTVAELDLIKCGDRYSINQCSMGIDAEVCAKQADFKKLPFLKGDTAYTAALLYCFLGKMNSRFTVSIDDGEPFTSDVLFALCGNSRWYGGGYLSVPEALPDDGLLDFVIVKKDCSKLKLLTLISAYKRGEHLNWDRTLFSRGKKMSVKSSTSAAVNIDGEWYRSKECTFEIAEKGIKFVVPYGSDFFDRKK